MEISRAHQTPVESAHWPFGQYRIQQEPARARQRAVVKGEVRGEGRLPKKSDVGAMVNGLNQPLPLVRFQQLVQKAAEVAQEVKSLGNSLLAAMKKEGGESPQPVVSQPL
jgi:hypothetical protein